MSDDILLKILKDTEYELSIFSQKYIEKLKRNIIIDKELEGEDTIYVNCFIRNKNIILKPEEIVRQLYIIVLLDEYNYPIDRVTVEHPINFGREVKKADIVVFDKDRPTTEYIIVEVKKPKLKEGKGQLRSYCNATGAPIGVWTNGKQISRYNRKDPNYFEDITDIPNSQQTLSDILKEKFTLKDLIIKDKIPNEGKSLKTIIQEMEDEVLANAGVDVFEECFKLIITKLNDEIQSRDDYIKIKFYIEQNLNENDRNDYDKIKDTLSKLDDSGFRTLEFRNIGESESELSQKINSLFTKAKNKWRGIFTNESRIKLTPSHLSVCVSSLQDVKLLNSNLQIIDEAFEYLVSKSQKGEKGQYFTPRHVIDMCVKMLNPLKGEFMIDPAAGSCGFTVHTIFYITNRLFTNEDIPAEDKDAINRIFGIDFDEKVVLVARALNLIAGDGESNVIELNSLDYERWDIASNEESWLMSYGPAFDRLKKLRKNNESNKDYMFDIVMTNPPFAGDLTISRIIHKYELGYNKNGMIKAKIGRDVLFIERALDFLKPGGRLAIVLPRGRLNNITDLYIRNFISEKVRILAVVDLDINTFKPHTGTRTSVLFLQKWNDDEKSENYLPILDDYPIFFAKSEKSGKNNSGEYVFVKKENGVPMLDKNGHMIIDHDLHNHGGELPDGIAEKFIQWAKSEKLTFWNEIQ